MRLSHQVTAALLLGAIAAADRHPAQSCSRSTTPATKGRATATVFARCATPGGDPAYGGEAYGGLFYGGGMVTVEIGFSTLANGNVLGGAGGNGNMAYDGFETGAAINTYGQVGTQSSVIVGPGPAPLCFADMRPSNVNLDQDGTCEATMQETSRCFVRRVPARADSTTCPPTAARSSMRRPLATIRSSLSTPTSSAQPGRKEAPATSARSRSITFLSASSTERPSARTRSGLTTL